MKFLLAAVAVIGLAGCSGTRTETTTETRTMTANPNVQTSQGGSTVPLTDQELGR